jgi:hypothetical protein
MKFKETPSPEKFILTNKKKRIIKAILKEFMRSIEYHVHYNKFYSPEVNEVHKFLLSRTVFLKNILYEILIEKINGEFTAIHFRHKKYWMLVESQIGIIVRNKTFITGTLRFKFNQEEIIKRIDQYTKFEINCLDIS